MSVVSTTLGHHYVVSAGHELAALAAFEVLDGGGNAIDAGIAAMLTLGVVYSDQVSVAGVAPMMIRLGETGEIVGYRGDVFRRVQGIDRGDLQGTDRSARTFPINFVVGST